MTNCEEVLRLLQLGPVSAKHFDKGFRLAARIYDLRKAGHEIRRSRNDAGPATYTLTKGS